MPDDRRHVAVVVPSLTRAGAERVAETLAQQFARSCRVTVVTMDPRLTARELRDLSTPPWTDRIPAGCHHVHLPASGSGISRFLTLAVRFALLARREGFDAVYSFLTWTNILVVAAKPLGGRYRHVASEHAMAETLRGGGGRSAMLTRALPVVYRWPDWVVVVSDAARASLLAAGLLPCPSRAVAIPNPIDVAEIRKLSGAACDVPAPTADGVVLVCVGRLHEHKDHLTLLRAMTRLPERYCLLIVGEGPLRNELAQTVERLGLEQRVRFSGELSNPYPVMRRADVIVLSSRQEGFGLVAAEAGALGRPFVGTAVGGLAELCALLSYPTFEVGDDEDLAAKIVMLGSRPPAHEGVSALVERSFDPAEISARYLRLTSR